MADRGWYNEQVRDIAAPENKENFEGNRAQQESRWGSKIESGKGNGRKTPIVCWEQRWARTPQTSPLLERALTKKAKKQKPAEDSTTKRGQETQERTCTTQKVNFVQNSTRITSEQIPCAVLKGERNKGKERKQLFFCEKPSKILKRVLTSVKHRSEEKAKHWNKKHKKEPKKQLVLRWHIRKFQTKTTASRFAIASKGKTAQTCITGSIPIAEGRPH